MMGSWRKSGFRDEWEAIEQLGRSSLTRTTFKTSLQEDFRRKLSKLNLPLNSPSMPFYILIRTYMMHLPLILGIKLVYLKKQALTSPISECLDIDAVMKEAEKEYEWALKDHKRQLDAQESSRRHAEMLRIAEEKRLKQAAEDKRRYEEQRIQDDDLRRRKAIDLHRRQLQSSGS